MNSLLPDFFTKWSGRIRLGSGNRGIYYENSTVPNDLESFFLYLFFCLFFLAITAMVANIHFSSFPFNPFKWHLHAMSYFKVDLQDSCEYKLWWFALTLFTVSVLSLFLALFNLFNVLF